MVFHNWHLVTLSPWPLIFSFSLLILPSLVVFLLQGYLLKYKIFYIFIILGSIFILISWFMDIIFESAIEGNHDKLIQRNFDIGFLLFIFSEVMFFVAFFWAFFHSSLFPVVELGLSWPPTFLKAYILNPLSIPLLNTLILLTSGMSLTVSHLYFRNGNYWLSLTWLLFTIELGCIFIFLQDIEYFEASFNITDSVYGSVFFMCTGFHGFHVIIGTIFLIVTLIRRYNFQLSQLHHNIFIVSAWYWHFVDIVWIFLYIVIYYLGYDLVYDNLLIENI